MSKQSNFTQPLDTSNVASGYAKAAAYNPVDRSVLENALKPYKLKFSSSAKLDDVAIRKMAAKAVVGKFYASKKAAGLIK